MSPDLLTLARQVVALPGAPAYSGDGVLFGYDGKYPLFFDGGLIWRQDDVCRYVIDLSHDATGGVMLAALGPVTGTARDRTLWTTGDYEHQGEGPTLAAACARVMVARGRW